MWAPLLGNWPHLSAQHPPPPLHPAAHLPYPQARQTMANNRTHTALPPLVVHVSKVLGPRRALGHAAWLGTRHAKPRLWRVPDQLLALLGSAEMAPFCSRLSLEKLSH